MFTISRTIKIAITIFATGVLSSAGALDTNQPADTREREQREAQERREAERHAWDTEQWGAADRAGARHEADPEEMMREIEKRMDELHAEIHDVRLREVEVGAEFQRATIDGREDIARQLQRQLIELQRRRQQLELEVVQHQRMYETGIERHELMRMTDRLEYVSNWRDVAFSTPHAVMMATQSIVELFAGREEPERAAEILNKLLESVDQLGSRTAIRFALKDIYMAVDDVEQAARQMTLVIQENSRALQEASH